jgi:hypothetical protein
MEGLSDPSSSPGSVNGGALEASLTTGSGQRESPHPTVVTRSGEREGSFPLLPLSVQERGRGG